MKREILKYFKVCTCCPVHDMFPSDTYKNNKSKHARSLGIKKEHRYVRRKLRLELTDQVKNLNGENGAN